MSKVVYPVRLRPDSPKAGQLKADIMSAPVVTRIAVLDAIELMERDLVPSKRLEILDDRFETYALSLGSGPKCLLFDLDTTQREWTVLALSDAPVFHNEAYMNACEAHGLISPKRMA